MGTLRALKMDTTDYDTMDYTIQFIIPCDSVYDIAKNF
jgi:hypothetical protein